MGVKTPIRIELEPEERRELEVMSRAQVTSHRMVNRARIILAWLMARRLPLRHALLDVDAASPGSGRNGFGSNAWSGLPMNLALADRRFSPPSGGRASGQARVRAA
jgi:hypothetical protein